MHTKSYLLAALAATASASAAVVARANPFASTGSSSLPVIDLDYSKIQAYEIVNSTAGDYYVFKNIRYAAPPVDSLRWAAPVDPLVETEVNNGTTPAAGNSCDVAEDCLFLDVWAPATAVEGKIKLPVLFFNYGGGWKGGSKDDETPEGLFAESNNGIVFVAYNYRVDIFGVLNGPTLQRSGGISNVAVYDARKAMEWVSTYISRFGGNEQEITNSGFSAGASQVAVALTAFGGLKWKPLFARAAIFSPGWVVGAGNAQAERFLENVTSLVGGCPIATSETIDCLRTKTFDEILAASQNITSTYNYQMQPRVDGVVLPETSEYLWSIGSFHPDVELLIGHSAHETDGTATAGVTDDATFRANFKVIFPAITDWAIDQIEELYPLADFDSQGLRFAHATQHYDLVGKVLPATNAYQNRTYNYINNLGTATLVSIFASSRAPSLTVLILPHRHGSDQSYWWYNANAAAVDTSVSIGGGMGASISGNGTEIAKRMQQYLLSFVITGNPNTLFAGPNTTSENGLALLEDGWPLYNGNPTDQVVSFDETGFSVVGDELDNDQVKFWNKALWN